MAEPLVRCISWMARIAKDGQSYQDGRCSEFAVRIHISGKSHLQDHRRYTEFALRQEFDRSLYAALPNGVSVSIKFPGETHVRWLKHEPWTSVAEAMTYLQMALFEEIERNAETEYGRVEGDKPDPVKFKFIDVGDDDAPVSGKRRPAKANGAEPSRKQRGCDHCPLQSTWSSLKTPRIPVSGIPDADILVIGEAPGVEEDNIGRPFVGPAGRVLQKILPMRQERRIAMTNTLRCFLGDTKVVPLGRINKIFKRRYKGVLVTARTANGRELSGTPNHPVLTKRGWVALGLLKQGDQLAGYGGAVEGFPPDVDYKPATLDELYRAALQSGNVRRVVGQTMNFYGEVPDYDVDVVTLPRDLSAGRKWQQLLPQLVFSLSDMRERDLQRHSALGTGFGLVHRFGGCLVAFSAAVAGAAFDALGLGMGLIPSALGFSTGAQRDPFGPEMGDNRFRVGMQAFGDTFSAFASQIKRGDVDWREPATQSCSAQDLLFFEGPKLDIAGKEYGFDALRADPEVLRYRAQGGTFAIAQDYVDGLQVREFDGHVYTLETSEGAYLAENLIVRNCHPPRNRDPLAAELHACSLHLETDIANGNFKAILGLGSVPLSRFLSGAGITQIHGLKFPVAIGGKVLWYYPAFHPSYILHTGESRGSYEQSPALPLLENDIKRFFAEIDSWSEPRIECPDPGEVICAYTEDEALHGLNQIDWERVIATHPLGLDIETNGLRPNAQGAQIMSAAVSDGNVTVAWAIKHPEGANHWGLALLLTIARYNRWVGHNAGFELGWLYEHARQAGIDWQPDAGFDDSMAAARLFQRRESCLNLGILTRIYCGTNVKTLSTISTERIAAEPLPEVLRYNGLDAWGCRRIFDELGPQVDRGNYQSLLDTIASVTAMQLTGLDIDVDAAHRLRAEWVGKAKTAETHAAGLHEVKRYVADQHREFSIGSAEQVGEALVTYGRINLPKNRDGTYKTDDATLTALAPDNPLALDTLAYRHATKMNSTYIEPVIRAPTEYEDGKIHPVYSVALTRTYRTSSEDPNAQNFPKRRDRELRRSIVPPKGCIWVSADFGQLEARVYAMASRDRELIRSIIGREDIHTYWLNKILDEYPPYLDRLRHMVTPNDTEAQIRKGGRDIVKSDFVFSSLYGSTARNAADRTGIPYDIVMQVLGDFWERYAAAAAWLKAQRRQYREHGFTRDLFGRERYSFMGGNEPVNFPIQATAARLVLDAQNELHQLSQREKDPHLLPRINIHDDLTFALPDDNDLLEAYIDGISEILVRQRYDWQIVPLMVEWKIGPNWCDLGPVHEFTGDYAR